VLRTLACLLVSTATLGPPVRAQAPIDSVAGCFALEVDSFRVSGGAASSSWQDPGLEDRIWLTTVRIRVEDSEVPWYVVRPAPGAQGSAFGNIRWAWMERSRRLLVDWDATMAGISMELTPGPERHGLIQSFEGLARWFSRDSEVPPGLAARVRARRTVCSAE
jgi:hypothetical protein